MGINGAGVTFPYKHISSYLLLLPGLALLFVTKPTLVGLVLFLHLYVLTLFDLHTMRLPNLLNGMLFLSGLLFIWFLEPWLIEPHLIGALVGLMFPVLLNLAYEAIRGKSGIGMGDAKLLAAAGMWLGWYNLPFVLLIASVVALLFAVIQIMLKTDVTLQSRIPFGPFICGGIWSVWLIF
ncbi:prepilin peptidase [Kordiimonas laminariae]|uniref:prepilin peptidase n=1 Tax=Kordiimonas laminariae TaxID=2917717 RepID=UPI001FF1A277|nr:A24 family peptidase [Kordiimonas laminariae]MCK0068975.1 A24 family peptidase [Kordiimonas laminariae]